MIEVKNLTKNYGNKVGVKSVSFTVEKGEILGFLGPNGAGKSTTMNVITGYKPATEGSVTIGGYSISEQPREAKKIVRVSSRNSAAVPRTAGQVLSKIRL